MVELALVLPALLALALGVASLTTMYRAQMRADTAAAETARMIASDDAATPDEAAAYARSCVGDDEVRVTLAAPEGGQWASYAPGTTTGGIGAARRTQTLTRREAPGAHETSGSAPQSRTVRVTHYAVSVTCERTVDVPVVGSWTASATHVEEWSVTTL